MIRFKCSSKCNNFTAINNLVEVASSANTQLAMDLGLQKQQNMEEMRN